MSKVNDTGRDAGRSCAMKAVDTFVSWVHPLSLPLLVLVVLLAFLAHRRALFVQLVCAVIVATYWLLLGVDAFGCAGRAPSRHRWYRPWGGTTREDWRRWGWVGLVLTALVVLSTLPSE